MRLISRRIDKEGEGDVRLVPEAPEDMWHVYNLLAKGDLVTAVSFRKVVQQASATGSVSAQKMKIYITVEIESIEFDTSTCELRIKGKNTQENEHLRLGQYHSLELALNRPFTLSKANWDSIYLERIDMACDVKHSAEVAAVIMQPGLANLCLVTTHMTQVRQKIEMAIPRKRVGSTSGHDASLKRFFTAIMDGMRRHFDMNIVKVVLIASPGFLKEDFLKWMHEEAVRQGDRMFIENKGKFVACTASSGFKHALKEVLADPAVASRVADTKAFSEVRALDAFFEMMNTDPDRAYYGYNHVRHAAEAKAIDTLMVTDELFRSSDIVTRKNYITLVESVRENGGEVKIFSTLHVSGEQLNSLSGVAALLRFPMPEVEMGDAEAQAEETEDGDQLYPPSAAQPIHLSASMHQLGASAASSSSSAAASSADPFRKQDKPISSSVSFGNIAAMRSKGTDAPSQSAAASSSSSSSAAAAPGGGTSGGGKGIIKGFASEHGI